MISVILNVYNRPYTLEKQIQAIKDQSIPINPTNIHVWYNYSEVSKYYPNDKEIKTYTCSWNTKFWGRFMLPLLLDTEYIAIFDDDTIPEKDWFANCIKTINKPETNGILGGSGVRILGNGYKPNKKYGWNGVHSDKPIEVDLVGHAWFFRQEWIKYMWYEKPPTWNNGEDIMFSFLAQKHGGIKTFVPPHPEDKLNLWSSNPKTGMEIGSDENASWLKGTHNGERDMVCQYCLKNNWKTIENLK